MTLVAVFWILTLTQGTLPPHGDYRHPFVRENLPLNLYRSETACKRDLDRLPPSRDDNFWRCIRFPDRTPDRSS